MASFDKSTELLIELAKTVVAEMRSSYPDWKEAYLRLQAGEGSFEVKCSYVLPSDVQILNVLSHKQFIAKVQHVGMELRESLPRAAGRFCVAIMRVGSDLSYETQYEYKDDSRWQITKIGGGSGLPVGYASA